MGGIGKPAGDVMVGHLSKRALPPQPLSVFLADGVRALFFFVWGGGHAGFRTQKPIKNIKRQRPYRLIGKLRDYGLKSLFVLAFLFGTPHDERKQFQETIVWSVYVTCA